MILQVIVLRLINLVIQVHVQDRNPDLGLNQDHDQYPDLDQEAGHTRQGHHHSRQGQDQNLLLKLLPLLKDTDVTVYPLKPVIRKVTTNHRTTVEGTIMMYTDTINMTGVKGQKLRPRQLVKVHL